MSIARQFIRLAIALLVCVVAVGCGGATGQGGESTSARSSGAPGDDSEEQAPGGPLAPEPGGGENEPQARGSPIKIPPFQQIGGQPVDDVRQQIEAAIRSECKPRHDLCVTTVVKPRKGADSHACFDGTSPSTFPDSAELDRGEVLTVYSAPGACESPDSSSEPPPSDTTGPPPDSTGPSENSQPPTSS